MNLFGLEWIKYFKIFVLPDFTIVANVLNLYFQDDSLPLKSSLKRITSSSNYSPKNKKSKMVVRVAAPQTKTDISSRKSVSKKANLSLNRKNSPLKPKAHQNSIKLTENNVYVS